MKIAVIQLDHAPLSHEAALISFEGAIQDAGGADLVVFPELALCGYGPAAQIQRLATNVHGPVIASIRALAARHAVALAFGYAERDGDRLFNAAMLIGQDGQVLVNYRKRHLWAITSDRFLRLGPLRPWSCSMNSGSGC
jgi:predicted amidohydrolase